jgi:hypothetical protein
MIHDEKHYEILAALAVAGQLADTELLELEQHAIRCSSCTRRIAEMEATSRRLFMLNALKSKALSTPAGMQERFSICAINAGVPLSRRPLAFIHPMAFRLASVIALMVVLSVVWKIVSEKASTAAKVTVNPPTASGRAPIVRATSTVNRKEYLAVSQPAKRRPLKTHTTQMQTHLVTFNSSEGNRAHRKALFTLNPTLFPGNGTTIGALSSIPNRFRVAAAGNFTLGAALSPKSSVSRTSVPSLWDISDQKESGQRVFYYNSTVAFLSFLDYQSDFKPKTHAPDFFIYSAGNPTRSR